MFYTTNQNKLQIFLGFTGQVKISSCAAQTRSLRKGLLKFLVLTALHVQFVSPIITHDVKIRCI